MSAFPGRVGLQQRVFPAYRAAFFDRLALACRDGLSLFAGDARPDEVVLGSPSLRVAQLIHARNVHILRGPLYLCFQRGIRGWLEALNPDALILEANPRYLANWEAAAWMRRRSRPILGWGLGTPATRNPALRGLRKAYLRRFDVLIAYSTLGRDQYLAAGVPAERVFIAYNASEPPPPQPPDRPAPVGRPARVLFTGRLQARKRVDLLLQACAHARPQPELWVVGDGPARQGLERLAASLFPQAKFLGALQGQGLDNLFVQADLFVLPGTGGLAVQQAMAHGLPVIAAEGDGTQNDLVAPDNGWLVPPGDLSALGEALQLALADPMGLRQRGMASYRRVVERFNIDAMAQVFVDALRAASELRE